jgi:hypothetical protein
MAKRKGWQRALGGLGIGIANASQYAMQQQNLERQNERILGRQQIMDAQNFIESLTKEVSEGLPPEQAVARAKLRGINIDPAKLEAVRPTLRKRLGSALDKPIMDATSPESVPTMQDIASIGKAQGASFLPDEFMVEGAQTDDPLAGAGAAPELRDIVARAETKRRSLMDRPTERAEVQDPISGAKSLQFVSPYAGPIQTTPTAAQEGTLAGNKDVAENVVSGPSKVAQAAAEARATGQANQDVQNNPANVSGAAKRAGSIATAESNARLPNDIKIAQTRANIELQNATDKASAQNLAESTRAAQQMTAFFNKFKGLSDKINTREGIAGRAVGLMRAGQAMIGDDPDVAQMQQLISQNLRPLAILMGVREANVSESETKQALAGIGIKPWSTHTEAVNALRNLQDLIDLAPIVAARANPYAPIGDRISMASDLTQLRRQAEQDAIAGKYESYIDPVTLTPKKVIK